MVVVCRCADVSWQTLAARWKRDVRRRSLPKCLLSAILPPPFTSNSVSSSPLTSTHSFIHPAVTMSQLPQYYSILVSYSSPSCS